MQLFLSSSFSRGLSSISCFFYYSLLLLKFKRRVFNPRSPPLDPPMFYIILSIFFFNLEIFLVLERMSDIAGVIFFCVMSCMWNQLNNPYLLKGNQVNILLLCQHIHLQYCVITCISAEFFLILRFIKAMQIQSLIDFRISLKEKRNKVWETFSNVIKLNGLKADWAYNIHVHCTFHIKTWNYRCMWLKFSRLLRFWLLNSVDTAYIILFWCACLRTFW